MYCSQCGKEQLPDAHYCNNCGRVLAVQFVQQPIADPRYAPQPYAANRVHNHFRTLGILWLVAGVLRALMVGWVWVGWAWLEGSAPFPGIFTGGSHFFAGEPLLGLVRGGLIFASVLLVVQAALAISAGWGLLERQSWGRILAIIAGIFSLWHIPLGTALGVYTLWVLLPASSEMEYRTLARV